MKECESIPFDFACVQVKDLLSCGHQQRGVAQMTKRTETTADKSRYQTLHWIEKKADTKHRETIRASVSLEADDSWLDE
jgi:hypothetical protein